MQIGILGNGQLAMMLGEAASTLGLSLNCYGPGPDAPAAKSCLCTYEDFANEAALRTWLDQQDSISYEFENIPPAAVSVLRDYAGNVAPSIIALQVMQNRVAEKSLAAANKATTAKWKAFEQVTAAERIKAFKDYLVFTNAELILKTTTFGYDGKGQVRIKPQSETFDACLEDCVHLLTQQPCIAEQVVPFTKEVSLISCRGRDGVLVHYPLSENIHRQGILRVARPLIDPTDIDLALQKKAEAFAENILANLLYVGILTIEFFVAGSELFVNEFAPRVHNSGHWTIEGSATSQFENHVRAIAGLPLGSTTSKPSLMYNLIGNLEYPKEKLAGAILHSYNKENRANRKVGHVTFVAEDSSLIPDPESLI